ncbi:SusD/RagB family nutrient-binding outer membrane lipoprotein [Sinomicrobium sp. M5D2P17]
MKKIIYILTSVSILLSSCDKGFEDLNEDPTKAGNLAVEPKFTAAMLYTSGDEYESWRANLIYLSTMMQHCATTAGYWSGDKYFWNRDYASSLYDAMYPNAVKSIEDIIAQLNEEGNTGEMMSIARILRVVIYHRLTDLYGDIPYTEAGKGVLEEIVRPKYDRQEDIYADMLKELEEAALQLETGTSELGNADIIFQGDLGKWKKYAYSMMLRLGLRLVKVDPAASQQWVTKAIEGGVMESNDDIAFVAHQVEAGVNKNGNGQTFTNDNSPRLSTTFVALLQDDPRFTIYGALPQNTGEKDEDDEDILRTNEERLNPETQKGLPNGLDGNSIENYPGGGNLNTYTEPNRLYITGENDPMFLQTYAEVEFMLAEAAFRWGLAGGDVEAHYDAGVTAAMKYLEMYDPEAVISNTEIAEYLSENPFDPSKALEQINIQYWIVTFLNEYEAFANWRRTGFPELTPVNYPGNVTNGSIPRRLTYPQGEVLTNRENYEAVIQAQGPDVLTTRVWWDVD